MSKLKILLGDSLVYGIGSLAVKATQVLLLPLILVFLKKDEFGQMDFFFNIKNVVLIIYGWGVLTAIFKFSSISEYGKKVAYNGFLIILIIAVVSSVVLLMVFLWKPEVKKYIAEMVFVQLISIIGAWLTIPLAILRQQRRPFLYVMVNLLYTVVLLVVTFLMLKVYKYNYLSFFWGHTAAAIVAFCVGVIFIKDGIEIRFSSTLFKKMFSFGFSILLNSISFVIILATSRFFLKGVGSFDDIGVLGMAQRLALIVGALLISPFTLAWLPFVNNVFKRDDFHILTNRVFSVFLWVGLWFCFALEVLQYDLFFLIRNVEYLDSLKYVLPFSLSYLFQGFFFIFSAGIYLAGNNAAYRIIGVLGPLFNVGLYLGFKSILSINVAAQITLVSFVFVAVLAYVFGNKHIGIRLFNKRNVSIFVLYLGLLLVIRHFSFVSFSLPVLIIKIALVILLLVGHVFTERRLKF